MYTHEHVGHTKTFPKYGTRNKLLNHVRKNVGYFFYSFVKKIIQIFDIMKELFNYKVVCIKKIRVPYNASIYLIMLTLNRAGNSR